MIILRNKFFSDGSSDRNSEWWKRKIAEEKKRNPNSPRIKKWESVLQYTLEKEGKADPKKAQEAASRAAQGHSAYSGRQSSGSGSSYSGRQSSSGSSYSQWSEDFKKKWEDAWKKQEEEYRQREAQENAQKEADIRGYRNKSSRIKEDIRRKFNKKNYTGESLKNFRKGVTIMAGVAIPVAAYSAYRSKKSRDKWKEAQKSYSSRTKTKTNKYYQGEETNSQKANRVGESTRIASSGVILGGGLGGFSAGSKVSDAINRVNRSHRAETRARDALYDSLDRNKRLNIYREYFKDDAGAATANLNYIRRMEKLGEKAVKRGILKGAAVGGTIGGLAAYAYNNSAKTKNEKANVRRRKKELKGE